MVWKSSEAKNRFGNVMDKALSEGPQTIRRRGKDEVVVLSAKKYDQLRAKAGESKKRRDFLKALLGGPSLAGLELERVQDDNAHRDVEW